MRGGDGVLEVIDTHCDALLKLQKQQRAFGKKKLSFKNAREIETNLKRLKKGKVKLQFFAIFIHPKIPSTEKWQHALEQIDLFFKEIIEPNKEMKHIKNWQDLFTLKDGEIGAVLSLEGAEPIGNDLMKLRQLYRLGVKSIGLTWNKANLCADGIGEKRGAGLTELGKEVVRLNNHYNILTDVSHASVKAFWDILKHAKYPFASHSNAYAICNHPRNLSDEQIKALFQKNGFIHLVFNPPFIKTDHKKVQIDDFIKHIDHICALGGKDKIGFGSDFDGIDTFVKDLEHAGKYQNLIENLLKYYTEEEVKGFAYKNFLKQIEKFFNDTPSIEDL